MLLAYEAGASLIVAVGTHATMVEFLDKGRRGMSSTFLTRLRLGPMLVDAKGVRRLYEGRVRRRDILVLVLAALLAIIVIGLVAQPIHTYLDGIRAHAQGPLVLDHPLTPKPAGAHAPHVNFRFHVVSLIAVFLALAIGTVMGSTFVGRGVVDSLQNRIDTRREQRRRRERDENEQLQSRDRRSSTSTSTSPQSYAVGRSLAGVARRPRRRARRRRRRPSTAQAELLRQAGATVPGVVWLEDSWNLERRRASCDALRDATGLTNRAPTPLRDGGRRAARPPARGRAAGAGADDVLDKLADAKFVTLAGCRAAPTPTAADFAGVAAAHAACSAGPDSSVPADTTPALAAGMVDGERAARGRRDRSPTAARSPSATRGSTRSQRRRAAQPRQHDRRRRPGRGSRRRHARARRARDRRRRQLRPRPRPGGAGERRHDAARPLSRAAARRPVASAAERRAGAARLPGWRSSWRGSSGSSRSGSCCSRAARWCDAPALERVNYRGRIVFTAAGLFLVMAVLVVEAGRSGLGAFGLGDEPGLERGPAAGAVRRVRVRAARLHRRRARRRGPRLPRPPPRARPRPAHERHAEAARRRRDRARARGRAGVRHLAAAVRRRAADRARREPRQPARPRAGPGRSSARCSPTCRSRSSRAPDRSASRSRRSSAPRSACCPRTCASG